MKTLTILLATAAIALLIANGAGAVTYMIDPDHSNVTLHATHLGIGAVDGRFDKFSGSFEYDPANVAASKVRIVIEASSINTNQRVRDDHIRSADFLDAQKFPEITFESTEIRVSGQSGIRIAGNLTLHGVTRPMVLIATLRGTGKDADGKNRIAFDTNAQINRQDFGMTWNKTIGGNMLVGQIISLFMNVEGLEQAEAPSK